MDEILEHPQRRGGSSALIILVSLFGCALSIGGCVTPIHQQKAAESFERAYMALADFRQYKGPAILEWGVVLEATKVALQPLPGESLHNDRIVRAIPQVRMLRTIEADTYRTVALIPKTVLEDDREGLLRIIRTITQHAKDEGAIRDPQNARPPSEFSQVQEINLRAASKEEVLKRAAQVPMALHRGLEDMKDNFRIDIVNLAAHAAMVKQRAAGIIENPERPLLERLAALEKFSVASEVPAQTDALLQAMETVFGEVEKMNGEISRALLDPKYKWEDLLALIDKVEKAIGKASSIMNGIKALLGFR